MISWSPSDGLKSQAGFGLMQVMFILVGIAIAASVAVMNSAQEDSSAGGAITYARFDKIRAAASRYRADGNGTPPTLDALTTAPSGAAACAPDTVPGSSTFRQLRGWCGPYLDRDPAGADQLKRDGWRTALQYNGLTGTTLRSCGPNRVCGDTDDITTTL